MESTRPIRALLRGLDALSALNSRDGAIVSELVNEIRLPRTTVYRVLETLCEAGFVQRDPNDDRYRLTMLVRALSDSFDVAATLVHVAQPYLGELARALGAPVALATLSGTCMRQCETAGVRSDTITQRVPLLTSASGLVYLAHCVEEQRDSLLAVLARSRKAEGLPRTRSALLAGLQEIEMQGFAAQASGDAAAGEITLGIPLIVDEELLAVLTVRYPGTSASAAAALARYLPRMRSCALRIRHQFLEQQAGTYRAGAPATAI
jgi:IclR family mhp operon transcriptional activator